MKQILFFLILILWTVFQARRKAMREERKLKDLRERVGVPQQSSASMPVEPVTADVNARDWSSDLKDADRFISNAPSSLPASGSERPRKKSRRVELQNAVRAIEQQPFASSANDEIVERVVTPGTEDAYTMTAVTRRTISFNKESLRTFFVTREVLGPPRARKPYRPGMKGRE